MSQKRLKILPGSIGITDECKIVPDPFIEVRKIEKWEDTFRTNIFEAAGEPWETDVVKMALEKDKQYSFLCCLDFFSKYYLLNNTKLSVSFT